MASRRQKSEAQVKLEEAKAALEKEAVDIDEAKLQALLNELIPTDWKEEAVGFPPYWKAEVGEGIRGILLARDDRDANFVRYHIEATVPVECRKGKVDDGEVVTVGTGEIFTMSAYRGLPLENYFGYEVAIVCVGSRKLPPNDESEGIPRDFLVFRTFIPPQVSKLLAEQRKTNANLTRETRQRALAKALENIELIQSRAKRAQTVEASA